MTPREPWLAKDYAALRRRGVPQVWFLASWRDAQQLAAGQLPRRLQRQAVRLVTAAAGAGPRRKGAAS